MGFTLVESNTPSHVVILVLLKDTSNSIYLKKKVFEQWPPSSSIPNVSIGSSNLNLTNSN